MSSKILESCNSNEAMKLKLWLISIFCKIVIWQAKLFKVMFPQINSFYICLIISPNLYRPKFHIFKWNFYSFHIYTRIKVTLKIIKKVSTVTEITGYVYWLSFWGTLENKGKILDMIWKFIFKMYCWAYSSDKIMWTYLALFLPTKSNSNPRT